MKKQIKVKLSEMFSKIWLGRNKKTVELDARECSTTFLYIQAAKAVMWISFISLVILLGLGILGKTGNNDMLFLAGISLSLAFNAIAAKIGKHFYSTIGKTGCSLAKDWRQFLKDCKRLGVKISTNEPNLLESNLQSHVVKILEERAKEIYDLEQLGLESERLKLRPTMDEIINLFEKNLGLKLGKIGNFFPEDSRVHEEPRLPVEITCQRVG